MKFAFIAKHRGLWPASFPCEALGVSRGGLYAWLTRPRSTRSRVAEELAAKVRASFLASDRSYGARRVWRDLLAEGVRCGLHKLSAYDPRAGIGGRGRPRTRRFPPRIGSLARAGAAPRSVPPAAGGLGIGEKIAGSSEALARGIVTARPRHPWDY